MNSTLFTLGCCNVVIYFGSVRKNGSKGNLIGRLNLIFGLLLIVASLTFFNHS